MSSISNIGHFVLPNDALANLTEIYRWIGRNEEMYRVFKSDIDRVVEQTIQRDGYFLARILDLNITDTRMRLILTKDSNPRNKEERTLFRIKERSQDARHKQMRHQIMTCSITLTSSSGTMAKSNSPMPRLTAVPSSKARRRRASG